jgi:hypothetical protein
MPADGIARHGMHAVRAFDPEPQRDPRSICLWQRRTGGLRWAMTMPLRGLPATCSRGRVRTRAGTWTAEQACRRYSPTGIGSSAASIPMPQPWPEIRVCFRRITAPLPQTRTRSNWVADRVAIRACGSLCRVCGCWCGLVFLPVRAVTCGYGTLR